MKYLFTSAGYQSPGTLHGLSLVLSKPLRTHFLQGFTMQLLSVLLFFAHSLCQFVGADTPWLFTPLATIQPSRTVMSPTSGLSPRCSSSSLVFSPSSGSREATWSFINCVYLNYIAYSPKSLTPMPNSLTVFQDSLMEKELELISYMNTIVSLYHLSPHFCLFLLLCSHILSLSEPLLHGGSFSPPKGFPCNSF